MGPKMLVVKRGEYGALLFAEDRMFVAPALPLEEVVDPTGAGDTFAGGFMGYLASRGAVDFDTLCRATIVGSVMASFVVEDFSHGRLQSLSMEEIEGRYRQFVSLTDVRGDV